MKTNAKLLVTTAIAVAVGVSGAFLLHGSPLIAQSSDAAKVDTSDAIRSANWSDNVTITINDDATFRYESDGLPSTYLADVYLVPDDPGMMPFSTNPDATFSDLLAEDIEASPIDSTITTQPVYTEVTTDTTLGQIGVAINGARLFNDYEDMERTIVALDDNVIHDHAAFVDECNGHPLGDGTTYHYHGIPVCLTAQIDVDGEHSYMIGVLQDGFPVYSNQGENGEIMVNADLDECGGHFGVTPEFPEGIYHYHLTADEAPYTIDCYHGEVEVASMGRGGGGGPDLGAAAEQLGISEQELATALGDGRPNFEAAAQTLGMSVDDLMAVLPAPPQ